MLPHNHSCHAFNTFRSEQSCGCVADILFTCIFLIKTFEFQNNNIIYYTYKFWGEFMSVTNNHSCWMQSIKTMRGPRQEHLVATTKGLTTHKSYSWDHVSINHFDGLVQDCSISIASALEILQSCNEPSIYMFSRWQRKVNNKSVAYPVVMPLCVANKPVILWLIDSISNRQIMK